MSMAKPQSILQAHSYKQTEKDWFLFAKKIWRDINSAPNFMEYRVSTSNTHNNT